MGSKLTPELLVISKEHRKHRMINYRITHKDQIRKSCHEYYLKNKQKINAYAKVWQHKQKLTVLTYYSNGIPKCKYCYKTGLPFLTLDHIEGNGNKHRLELTGRKKGTGGTFYRWIINNKFPIGFQVLCWNCNCVKGMYDTDTLLEILEKEKLIEVVN